MKDQPVIDLPKTTIEVWLDVASWLFATAALAIAIGYYPDLPEQIPTHFGPSGRADNFGPKVTIFILPVLSLVLVGGIVFLSKYPHRFNYLNKITPENAAFEYQRMRLMLRVVNMLTSLLFLVITRDILNAVSSDAAGVSAMFWIVFVLLLVVPPFFLGWRGKKGR